MSEWKNQDFSQLTVLELRKVAKAMGVQLGAGISKAGIIEKLDRARNAKYSDIPAVPMDFTPIPKSDDKQESPVEKAEVPAAVKDEKPSESPACQQAARTSRRQTGNCRTRSRRTCGRRTRGRRAQAGSGKTRCARTARIGCAPRHKWLPPGVSSARDAAALRQQACISGIQQFVWQSPGTSAGERLCPPGASGKLHALWPGGAGGFYE